MDSCASIVTCSLRAIMLLLTAKLQAIWMSFRHKIKRHFVVVEIMILLVYICLHYFTQKNKRQPKLSTPSTHHPHHPYSNHHYRHHHHPISSLSYSLGLSLPFLYSFIFSSLWFISILSHSTSSVIFFIPLWFLVCMIFNLFHHLSS